MLSFDLISHKMPFAWRQKPVEWSERHHAALKKKTSTTYYNYFWPFLTPLEQTFELYAFDLISIEMPFVGTKMPFRGRQKHIE